MWTMKWVNDVPTVLVIPLSSGMRTPTLGVAGTVAIAGATSPPLQVVLVPISGSNALAANCL